MTQLRLLDVDVELIKETAMNPRASGDDPQIEALGASFGESGESIATPIVVMPNGNGGYILVAGSRRLRAAKARHLKTLPCLVRDGLDAAEAHRLSLLENLHRRDLHPIDEAASLRLLWLTACADAMGLGEEARRIMNAQEAAVLPSARLIESLLTAHGFVNTAPPVTQEDILSQIGIAMSAKERMRKMRVLSLDPNALALLRDVEITEAALRAVGQLSPEGQCELAEAISADPRLARKTATVANLVKRRGYSLSEALDVARGGTGLLTDPAALEGDPDTFDTSALFAAAAPDDDPPAPPPLRERVDSPPAPAHRTPNGGAQSGSDDPVVEKTLRSCDEFVAALKAHLGGKSLDALPGVWPEYIARGLEAAREAMEEMR